MSDKTNMDILEDANAINSDEVTDAHKDIINNDFSAAEMQTLIKMQQKIKGEKFSSGAAF